MAATAMSAENIRTEPVISPKDAVYRLSYENYGMTWRQFKLDHNRSYESAREDQEKFTIFMKNVKKIERHNWQFHNRLTTYWMDINEFSDSLQTTEEWQTPVMVNESSPRFVEVDFMNRGIPSSIDWRTRGYVTAVKNQGHCGSCYAFGAIGALEGQWFKKTGQLISLSAQQIVDCSRDFGNTGCGGGRVDEVYDYIKAIGGIAREEDYPYFAQEGRCAFKKSGAVAKIRGYEPILPVGNERALQKTVATVGPIAVGYAVTENFLHYKGGIFVEDNYGEADHAVLVVGYGTKAGQDYWTIKNSWGLGWGDRGYAFVARNRRNMCHIASEAFYPTV